MSAESTKSAAAYLLKLRKKRDTVAALPAELVPRSLEEAYAIQDALHRLAGWPIVALKVGCTSRRARVALRVPHPIAGRIPKEGCFSSGERIPRGFFGNPPLIECEFALRVGEDSQVDACAPAIELVDPRGAELWRSHGLTTIADNALGTAIVIGAPVPMGAAGDLALRHVELRSGSRILATGKGSDILGGPLASVTWLLRHENSYKRAIAAGTWILTGTCTGLTPSRFGDSFTAMFQNLGEVSFSLGE